MLHLRKQLRELLEGSVSAAAPPPLGYPTLTHVRHCDSYTMGFDGYHKVPAWVYERYDAHGQHPATPTDIHGCPSPTLTGAEGATGKRTRSYFHADGSLPRFLQIGPTTYAGSGLDRGHMAPAAGHKYSQWGMDDTFRMSNIAPQVGKGFNRDYWARLEGHVRNLKVQYRTVHVFSGPVFAPVMFAESEGATTTELATGGSENQPDLSVIQCKFSPDGLHNNSVKWWTVHPWLGKDQSSGLAAVPNGFYKVVLAEAARDGKQQPDFFVAAFLIPNARISDTQPLESFVVPLSSLHTALGFELFPAIDSAEVERVDRELLRRCNSTTHPGGLQRMNVQVSHGMHVVQHLCSSTNGCVLPQPGWWKKRRSKPPNFTETTQGAKKLGLLSK
jgi:DNA/RNA endonuclease G (NUC1)